MKAKDQEKKDKNKALYISIGLHVVLALLFVIIAAWTEPDPPIPEYGIELAIIGQSSAPSSDNIKNVEPVVKQEQLEETVLKPATEEPVSESDEATPTEELTESVTEDINSPDANNEAETTKNIATEEEKAIQEANDIEESNTEATTSEPEVDDRAIFQDNSRNGGGETGEDDVSGGSSLNMSGWIWDFKPEPDDKSTENGKIVFQITVDEDGEIIGIQTIEKTVSPIVEKVYKNAVMELTFSKTSDNQSVANNSKGVITFIIQSK